jgi:hypothetical protein
MDIRSDDTGRRVALSLSMFGQFPALRVNCPFFYPDNDLPDADNFPRDSP